MLIQSNNGNHYYISAGKHQVLFINPLLKEIISYSEKKEINFDFFLNYIKQKYKKLSIKDVEYYYGYFSFLKKNNFFKKQTTFKMQESRSYNATDIYFYLTNTDQINFEVTDNCNLSCKYCGYSNLYVGHDNRKGINQTFDNAKVLLDYVVSLKKYEKNIKNFRNICLSFYGGEPLLNFKLIKKIVEYSKNIKLEYNNFVYQMTTNGTLIHKYIDYLVENDFMLSVSMDGDFHNNSYRIYKNGKNSFDRILKNINSLKRKYPLYFDKRIEFISVIHKKNNPKQIKNYFLKMFKKIPRMISLSENNINPKKNNFFNSIKNSTPINQNRKKFNSLKIREFIKNYSGFTFNRYDQLLNEQLLINKKYTGTCNPFDKSIFLTVNNKILPCERIPQFYALGGIKEKEVKIDFKEVAKIYNDLYKKFSILCDNCQRNNECSQCIFFIKIEGEKMFCPDFINKIESKKRYKKIMTELENNPNIYDNFIND